MAQVRSGFVVKSLRTYTMADAAADVSECQHEDLLLETLQRDAFRRLRMG